MKGKYRMRHRHHRVNPTQVIYSYGWRLGLLYLTGRLVAVVLAVMVAPFLLYFAVLILVPLLNR